MNKMIVREFGFSFGLSIICLILAFWFGLSHGGIAAAFNFLLIAFILGLMEVSLSFDNAVVNATVLKNMSPLWQQRFLTWGIFIAVFGMRFLFPIVIVAIVSNLGFGTVVNLAFNDGEQYGRYLEEAHISISAFGGTFLMLVFLKYLLDYEKEVHWLGGIERRLASIGRLDTVQVLLTGVLLLLAVQFLVQDTFTPKEGAVVTGQKFTALLSGTVGILTYIFVDGLSGLFDSDKIAANAGKAGLASFLYLEVLDASFSLDGVIGAFAITTEVAIITAGLTIGAAFVRSLTLLLVHTGTLANFRYLEHGAHYGIGALATIMIISLNRNIHIPELITGLIGVGFIVLSLYSSVQYNRRNKGLEQPAD